MKKYFSIVFMLATLLGVFHHHDDMMPHGDCQVCTIQASIADADTPADVVYFHKISLQSEATIGSLSTLVVAPTLISINARAPPKHS